MTKLVCKKTILVSMIFGATLFAGVSAQTDTSRKPPVKKYSLHWQATFIPQYHFDFKAPYTGDNSLLPSEPVKASLSATAYLNYRPFAHTYLVFNPESAGGRGLSQALGVAGFPNGEIYRVGDPKPKPFIARLYLEQRFPLSKKTEQVEDDLNQVAETTAKEYVSVLAGKFSLTDFFDNSEISHDPRTRFMNWSLMGSGSWDYPANTRGYTIGMVVQAVYHDWAFRTALTTVPIEANGPELQFRFGKAMGMVWEIEKKHLWQKDDTHFTGWHVGAFVNQAKMGNYRESVQTAGFSAPDITDSRQYGRTKTGYYISFDTHLGAIHHFLRNSWNDGKNETWAFTEIDRSLATGLQFDGILWKRKNDRFAIALVSNGISADHRDYLARGGYGFIIGDGKLNYGKETILETYYYINLYKGISISPNYQFVHNPAYNKDRGPVHIVSLRLHAEF